MRITGIRVEGYRSLQRLDFQLGDFTVITGANGSGKSNLVDAVNFVGEVYDGGLEHAVAHNGGLANLVYDRGTGPTSPVTFTIRAQLDRRDADTLAVESPTGPWSSDQVSGFVLKYVHTFTLALTDEEIGSEFRLLSDRIEFSDNRNRSLAALGFTTDEAGRPSSLEHDLLPQRTINNRMLREILDPLTREDYFANLVGVVSPTSLLLEWRGLGRVVDYIRRAIGGIRLYQLSPYQCRIPSVATPNAALERYGENLPAAAKHLERYDLRAWKLVESAMRSIVPELDRIDFSYTSDRRLELGFIEHGVTRRAWSASEVSDGTIQAFALFVALYDSRFPLLMVEEPENSVHPWILRQFIEHCRVLPDKQIVLTTHSPVVLNHVEPDSVRLMTMAKGASTMAPLLDKVRETRELIDSGELSLFDVYDSGVISSSVPQGLSREEK